MIPVIGFFEYGIAAVLGTAGMMAVIGWGLAADGAPGGVRETLEGGEEPGATLLDQYRKAA